MNYLISGEIKFDEEILYISKKKKRKKRRSLQSGRHDCDQMSSGVRKKERKGIKRNERISKTQNKQNERKNKWENGKRKEKGMKGKDGKRKKRIDR